MASNQPTERFTGLAQIYSRCRPSYPAEAVDFILNRCGLYAGQVLVDVGCGTGISSRLFAGHGLKVIGIEPNDDMRRQAEAEPSPPGQPTPIYRCGTAEATGLDDAVADAVLAAQAFHWFEPTRALAEFRRILRPGGWVISMWNERDEADTFTAAYGAIIRTAPEAAAVELPRGRAGDVLLESPFFEEARRDVFSNRQVLDEEGLLGRAFSASYAPHEGAAAEQFAAALRALFQQCQREDRVELRYKTSVYTARRPNE